MRRLADSISREGLRLMEGVRAFASFQHFLKTLKSLLLVWALPRRSVGKGVIVSTCRP